MRNIISKYCREEDGAAMVEYTALLGIILAGVIATVLLVGGWVSGVWTKTCDSLVSVGGSAACQTAPASSGG